MARDPFFAGDADVLQSYEFDYEAITKFQNNVAWSSVGPLCFLPPVGPVLAASSVAMLLVCGKQNIDDAARAQHLAINRDGIKYVVDKHDQLCRLECQQQGRVSKTVPYDKITDCDVEEPAGSEACCPPVPRTLHIVSVDTAGSDAMSLRISGLKDPVAFKTAVWAMKRGEGVSGYVPVAHPTPAAGAIPAQNSMGSTGGPGIEAQLQRQTALLEQILAQLKLNAQRT